MDNQDTMKIICLYCGKASDISGIYDVTHIEIECEDQVWRDMQCEHCEKEFIVYVKANIEYHSVRYNE